MWSGVGNTYAVTVNSVTTNMGDEYTQPAAGNSFLIVDVTTKNISTQEQSLSSLLDFTLRDAQGQQYTQTGAPAAQSAPDGKVEPGDQLRGQLVYEVPTNEQQFRLAFAPDVLASGQVIWDLSDAPAPGQLVAGTLNTGPDAEVAHSGAHFMVTLENWQTYTRAGQSSVIYRVKVRISLMDTQPRAVYYPDFHLTDEAGTAYNESLTPPAGYDGSVGVNGDPGASIPGGGSVEVNLYFTVPSSHQGRTLTWDNATGTARWQL